MENRSKNEVKYKFCIPSINHNILSLVIAYRYTVHTSEMTTTELTICNSPVPISVPFAFHLGNYIHTAVSA